MNFKQNNYWFIGLFSLFIMMQSFNISAAEITDVADAFDDEDPIDINIQVSYQRDLRKAKISREFKCSDLSDNCPGTNSIIFPTELEYRRVINTILIDTDIGIYKDIELFVSMPIIIEDSMELSFPSKVSGANSTISPDSDSEHWPPLFNVPYLGQKRSGFGDMSVGVKYSPFSQERDIYHPSWKLGMTYTIPTGSIKKATNNGVGEGMHKITLDTAISRRILFVEPYFGFFGTFKFGSSSGLFQNYGETQTNVDPGAEMGIIIGTEIVPWEVYGQGQKFAFDFGFKANYNFEGRGHSEIFDALGSSDCDSPDGCYKTTYTRNGHESTNPDSNPAIYKTDGITDIEPYGVMGAWAGFSLKPIEYVQLQFKFFYNREMEHFLTFADAGKDLALPWDVNFENSLGQNEYNPVYLEEVDQLGKRIKIEGTNVFGIKVGLTGRF